MKSTLERWQAKAKRLQSETYALYLAYRDPRTPWYAKALAALVLAYAFSPIDLIPDFIPLLGHLDDLVLVPAGLALALRIIPPEVLQEARAKSAEVMATDMPTSRAAAIVVAIIWLMLAALLIGLVGRIIGTIQGQ